LVTQASLEQNAPAALSHSVPVEQHTDGVAGRQLGAHFPVPSQVCPDGQALAQVPQLLGSVVRDAQ
jgi:hypothetical protein